MKRTTSKPKLSNRSLPALLAVGGSMAAMPAVALELGDLTVHSNLGQPLRASIAYALAPSEQLSDLCVSLRSGASASGLPNIGRATISVANGLIKLTGATAIREPMVSAYVTVNCPYAANISREYMLFIDPATLSFDEPSVAPQNTRQEVASLAAPAAPAARPVQQKRTVSKDISTATRYRVQFGDSLSEIAQRIENRPVALWPAVNAIFDANPDAFIDNDPNKLKAGAWLTIPSFGGAEAVFSSEVVANESPSVSSVSDRANVAESATPLTISDLVANEVVPDEQANVLPANDVESILIPDTQLEGPTTISASPNVPTAIINTESDAVVTVAGSSSPSWFTWLAGSGLAIIFGLLLFGRRSRERLNPEPIDVVEDTQQMRRISDVENDAVENDAVDSNDVDSNDVDSNDVDYDLSDDSPTEENLALDADLIIGTGLDTGPEMDIAKNFGFAETADIHADLPFEPEAEVTINEAAKLAPTLSANDNIADTEVPPADDDHYDMSVIVDATKMPRPEDVTEYDLRAVQASANDESLIAKLPTDSYTIKRDSDFDMLEKDYEDEMTATQALNEEIRRAAAELDARCILEEDNDADMTEAQPLATVVELDVTAQLPTEQEPLSDLDDTGINETLTVNMTADDETKEMPAANTEDKTIEMPFKSDKAS